jgi:hypothetical protein
VVFQQMLEKARGDRGAEILVSVRPPAPGEPPDRLWLTVDELTNRDDSLPARVDLAVGRSTAWQDRVRLPYRARDSHCLGQANGSTLSGRPARACTCHGGSCRPALAAC